MYKDIQAAKILGLMKDKLEDTFVKSGERKDLMLY